MKCKYCGHEIDEGSVFCKYCGKEQQRVKNCIKCGHEIDVDADFCKYCGTNQVGIARKSKRLKKYYWLWGICALLIVAVFVFVFNLFSSSEQYEEVPLIPIEENGKFGFMDRNGEVVIPFQWKEAEEFAEGLACVMNKDGWGYIDKTGKYIIQPQRWAMATSFHEGFACVQEENGKWGYIDHTGSYVINPQWNEALPFSEGLAGVATDEGWGFIDKKGKLVVPYIGNPVGSFHEGLAWVRFTNDGISKYGYIDKSGEVVIDYKYESADDFNDGVAIVNKGDIFSPNYFMIDKNGNDVVYKWRIDDQYGFMQSFSEGLIPARDENGKWGYIDTTGSLIIPFQWSWAGGFHEGFASVKGDNGLCGYIDKTGDVVIPCEWKSTILFFHNGVAKVCDYDETVCWINNTGKIIRIENKRECECYSCCNDDCKEIGAILEPNARGEAYVCKYCYGRGMVQGGDKCLPH